MKLDQLCDLLLERGNCVFQTTQTTFQSFLAGFFATLILGERAFEFEHPVAQFAVFFLEIKIVLHNDANDLAHCGLAVEHRLLTVGDGAENVAKRLWQQRRLAFHQLARLVGAQGKRSWFVGDDAFWGELAIDLLILEALLQQVECP